MNSINKKQRILVPETPKRKVLRAAAENTNFILVNLKIPRGDLKKIKDDAQKYYLGNVSAWIRYCCQNYKVKEDELVEIEA